MTTGARHRAREVALQMLYFWEVGQVDARAATDRFWEVAASDGEVEALPDVTRAFAGRLAGGTIEHLPAIDAAIERAAQNWRLSRMAVIDRLILRLAAFELLFEPDTPPSVVIDEAIGLARTFSEEDAVRFVNGVLDAIHKHRDD